MYGLQTSSQGPRTIASTCVYVPGSHVLKTGAKLPPFQVSLPRPQQIAADVIVRDAVAQLQRRGGRAGVLLLRHFAAVSMLLRSWSETHRKTLLVQDSLAALLVRTLLHAPEPLLSLLRVVPRGRTLGSAVLVVDLRLLLHTAVFVMVPISSNGTVSREGDSDTDRNRERTASQIVYKVQGCINGALQKCGRIWLFPQRLATK